MACETSDSCHASRIKIEINLHIARASSSREHGCSAPTLDQDWSVLC